MQKQKSGFPKGTVLYFLMLLHQRKSDSFLLHASSILSYCLEVFITIVIEFG